MSSAAVHRYGPSALGDDFRRFWRLTLTLAVTDFKLRYFGSVLGYAWSLVRPLLFFGVLYVIFTQVVNLGNEVPYYAAYLLTSMMLFNFFAEATQGAARSLVDRENLLRKIRFPRLVVPTSVTLTALFNLIMNFVAVFVFVIATGVRPHAGWLAVPFLIALLFLFALGVGVLLSALFVRFRDIQPIWEVTTQVLFYGSPILYVVGKFPDNVERIMMTNPLAALMTEMRHVFVDPNAPSAAEAIGGQTRLLIPLGIIVAFCALGYWTFSRVAPRIAENL
ncbi:MAG: ABC transporter permease [Solirubrobacteraceae bacterium]